MLTNQFAGFFTFDLFDLLILILGIHCYIVLVMVGFKCVKAIEPQQGDSLVLTMKSQGVFGNYFINLGMMKDIKDSFALLLLFKTKARSRLPIVSVEEGNNGQDTLT